MLAANRRTAPARTAGPPAATSQRWRVGVARRQRHERGPDRDRQDPEQPDRRCRPDRWGGRGRQRHRAGRAAPAATTDELDGDGPAEAEPADREVGERVAREQGRLEERRGRWSRRPPPRRRSAGAASRRSGSTRNASSAASVAVATVRGTIAGQSTTPTAASAGGRGPPSRGPARLARNGRDRPPGPLRGRRHLLRLRPDEPARPPDQEPGRRRRGRRRLDTRTGHRGVPRDAQRRDRRGAPRLPLGVDRGPRPDGGRRARPSRRSW